MCFESSPNHPLQPQVVEKLSSMKLASGAKKGVDHCLTLNTCFIPLQPPTPLETLIN